MKCVECGWKIESERSHRISPQPGRGPTLSPQNERAKAISSHKKWYSSLALLHSLLSFSRPNRYHISLALTPTMIFEIETETCWSFSPYKSLAGGRHERKIKIPEIHSTWNKSATIWWGWNRRLAGSSMAERKLVEALKVIWERKPRECHPHHQ